MSTYITIDGGTTNTRIALLKDFEIIDTLKFNIGAKANINNATLFKNTIKNGIEEILSKNNLSSNEVEKILASGMITSEFGLYKLDHITVPVGISELHNSMVEVNIDEISNIPFVFMSGVKTNCKELALADMMRGEETELMGLISNYGGNCLYILPGSHSKIVSTDENCKITDFKTMLTGEMLAAISTNTILKDCIDLTSSELDDNYLLLGFDYCVENGINNAFFKVRVLKNLFKTDKNQTYSFLMGIILCNEILEILKQNPKKIVIGGKMQLKNATYKILNAKSNAEIICIDADMVDKSPYIGAVKIFEYNIEK